MSEKHIRNFFKYLELDSVEFCYFENNNTELVIQTLNRFKITHNIRTQIRCGFSYMAECINTGIKPFLIGFSLDSSNALSKQHCNIEGQGVCHDIDLEIHLIKKLHEAELVDATFCAIKDSEDLTIDESLLLPTQFALDILKDIYS